MSVIMDNTANIRILSFIQLSDEKIIQFYQEEIHLNCITEFVIIQPTVASKSSQLSRQNSANCRVNFLELFENQ